MHKFKNADIDYYAQGMRVRFHQQNWIQIVHVPCKGRSLGIENPDANPSCIWLACDDRQKLELDLSPERLWIEREYTCNVGYRHKATVKSLGPDFVGCDSLAGPLLMGHTVFIENYTPVPIASPEPEPWVPTVDQPCKWHDVQGTISEINQINHTNGALVIFPGEAIGFLWIPLKDLRPA